jgi:hypothetical protein
MTRVRPTRDPLTGVTRLLVDATNVLHALARGGTRQPPAALIGRLRAAIPPEVSIELVFDGPTERGLRGERIAHGVSVRYGGRFSADTILITLVEEVGGPTADSVLVVTDDAALRHAIARRGARTAGASWLVRLLDRPRLASPSAGNRRPPAITQPNPRSISSPGAPGARGGSGAPGARGGSGAPGAPGAGGAPGGEARDRPADTAGWSPGRGATKKRGNGRRAPSPRRRPPAG